MSDFDAVITGIHSKVRMLQEERSSLRAELERQREHCQELQEALEQQNITITNLKEQNQSINLGNTLATKGDSTEIKHKIAQMIQTIDDALSLLSDTQ